MGLLELLKAYAKIEIIKTGMAFNELFSTFDAPSYEGVDAVSAYNLHLEFSANSERWMAGQYRKLARIYNSIGRDAKVASCLVNAEFFEYMAKENEADLRYRRTLNSLPNLCLTNTDNCFTR